MSLNGASVVKTDSRNNDTLISTSVSIVLRKVGLTIHWYWPPYRQSYIKQDLRYTGFDYRIDSPTYTGLDHRIDGPTQSRTYNTLISTSVSIVLHKQDLRYTGLDHRIDSPTGVQDQRFAGLKTAKIGLVGLSTQNVGLSVRPLGLSVKSQSQEITQSGNLHATIVYVIARLFHQRQTPQSAQISFYRRVQYINCTT